MPAAGRVRAAPGRPRRSQEPVRIRALRPGDDGPPDDRHSPSARARRAATAGSASCRARPARTSASAVRCRRSATWTGSSMSSSASGADRAGRREPNHLARFLTIWIVASLIATPLVILLLGPTCRPGNGSEQAAGHVTDNTVLLAMATPVLLLVVHLPDLRADRLPPAEGRRARRAGGARPRAPADRPGSWSPRCSCCRSPPTARCAWRAATAPARAAGPTPLTVPHGHEAAGAGDRPAVGVHLPLPDLRRRRDDPPRAAGQQDDRTARHLARRDPLLLGLPARRQGRRQPERRQRRVRQADQGPDLRSALRRAVRHLARRHVRPRARRQRGRLRHAGSPNSRRIFAPGDQAAAEVHARPTSPNRRGAANEHDDRSRHTPQPAAPARCGGG